MLSIYFQARLKVEHEHVVSQEIDLLAARVQVCE